VVILYLPGSRLVDLAGPLGVFDRATSLGSTDDLASYALVVANLASAHEGLGRGELPVPCVRVDELHRPIDTVLIAACNTRFETIEFKEAVLWLRQKATEARRIGAMSTGVLLLAEAGLINGRQATTDWQWCDELARRYPQVRVRPDATIIRDEYIYTSSGLAAGVHQALAFVEEDHGYDMAQKLALEFEVPLRPPRIKAVLSTPPQRIAGSATMRELQTWIASHFQQPLHVDRLAAIAGMSRRTFAREFLRALGITPARYIDEVRVVAARRLLDETVNPFECIACQCGFGSANSMRRAFLRILRLTPTAYRSHFQRVY
jgi:transcriptional regulator GlxA family with amidase domain